MAFVSSKH